MRTVMTLPPLLTAPHEARQFVHETLEAWQAETDLPEAELIVSELVTNAVRHEGAPLTVALTVNVTGVWIDVADEETQERVPRLIAAQHAAETGRGLTIVDSLAEEWGVTPTDSGRHVWVHLASTGRVHDKEIVRTIVTGYVERVVHGHDHEGASAVADQITGLSAETLRRVVNEFAHLAASLACLCAAYESTETLEFWNQQLSRMRGADCLSVANGSASLRPMLVPRRTRVIESSVPVQRTISAKRNRGNATSEVAPLN